MTEPGHLKPRTVQIVFALVAVSFVAVSLSVGAWPLVLGGLVAVLLFPLVVWVLNLISLTVSCAISGVICLLVPERIRTFASERNLHPATVALIFAAFIGALLLVYRDVTDVIGGLSVVGILLGLPWVVEWSRQRKLKKKSAAAGQNSGLETPLDT